MKKTKNIFVVILLIASVILAEEAGSTFGDVTKSVQSQLEESIRELNTLRETVVVENIPLSKQVNELEAQLVDLRMKYQQTTRILDSRTLDLSNLRSEIKSRMEESTYLSNLLSEYARNFESRLHIAEVQRYKDVLEKANLASENSNISKQEVYALQAKLLDSSLDRLEDALGGSHFNGTAIDASGLVKQGTFVMVGPAAIFRSNDGTVIGTVEQRLGSLEPSVVAFSTTDDAEAAAQVISTKRGYFPLDATLGNAHVIEATKQTILEHIQKGGPVMIPILGMAAAALLVAIWKWFFIGFIPMPNPKRFKELLDAVLSGDTDLAKITVAQIKGPFGQMLSAAVDHLDQPSELIEEVMYEKLLSTKLRLQKMLPFISISASSAPLLGLLGTVTGIINTFKLITVFGSGDVKTLSGGISEALITTEFGLIVAIPSLLLHALLSRKAKGITDEMEKIAITYINQANRTTVIKDAVESVA